MLLAPARLKNIRFYNVCRERAAGTLRAHCGHTAKTPFWLKATNRQTEGTLRARALLDNVVTVAKISHKSSISYNFHRVTLRIGDGRRASMQRQCGFHGRTRADCKQWLYICLINRRVFFFTCCDLSGLVFSHPKIMKKNTPSKTTKKLVRITNIQLFLAIRTHHS